MKRNIKRFTNLLFYTLLFAGIIIATYIIVSDARGYEYDLRTGEVNIKGLLLVESTPTNAQIYVDDDQIGATTDDRIELTAESHQVKLTKEGYTPWQKKVRILGESVTDLTYPRLFPEQIETSGVRSVDHDTLISSYNHRKALLYSRNQQILKLIDVADNQLSVAESIDLTTLTGIDQASQIKEVRWSEDNRYALVIVSNRNDTSVLYLDTESFAIKHLSQIFALPLLDVRFDHRNSDNLFWLSNQELRLLDVSSETVSAPLVTGVKQFQQYDQNIAYLEIGESQEKLSLNLARLSSEVTPQRIAFVENDNYDLAYRNVKNDNIIFLSNPDQSIRIFTISSENIPRVRTIDFKTKSVLSDYHRSKYILAKNGNKFFTIDPSSGQAFQFSLPYDSITTLSWLDSSYIGAVADGKAVIFEFDGKNITEVTQATTAIIRNEDFSELLSIDKKQLQRSLLRLKGASTLF